MNTNNTLPPEEFTKTENYLLGNMTIAERKDFEVELETNSVMQEELAMQKELQLSIEAGGLKESLHAIHEKVIAKRSSSKKNYWLAIAAGIAALVAVSVWTLNQKTPEDALFAQYASIDPGQPVPMSATADYSFHDAMVDYKAEKYDKAIEKWTVLATENPENKTLTYYLGASYFNQEKYNKALPYFEEVMVIEDSRFQAKAQWYAVLTWLKTENDAEILAITPLPKSEFSDKIKDIQQKLRNR